MKVFFPVSVFYPSKRAGGPSFTLYWHVYELNKNAIETSLVTSTFGIEDSSIKAHNIYYNEYGSIYYGSDNRNSLKTVIRSVREVYRCDIVHINSLFDALSISCFFYCKIFLPRKHIVLSVRGQLNPYALRISRYKKAILLFFYKMFYTKVLFHATADKEVSEIQSVIPRANIINIPNLIKPTHRLNLIPKKKILFMGRIHPIKAIDRLIRAVALSVEFQKNNFELEVAGRYSPRDQDYFEELQGLVSDLGLSGKVRFIGHVKGLEKDKLYAESYLVVLPSVSENFGNVVTESLNQGTPVIASLGTPWSMLEKYECGYHVENTPDKLAQALDTALSLNTDQYCLMRANAKRLVDSIFDIKIGINKWLDVYNDFEGTYNNAKDVNK